MSWYYVGGSHRRMLRQELVRKYGAYEVACAELRVEEENRQQTGGGTEWLVLVAVLSVGLGLVWLMGWIF